MDTLNHNLSVDNIIELAFVEAMEAAEAVTRESNGSEAWQAVQFNTKGLRKLQNQLKKIDGIRRDSYWDIFTPHRFTTTTRKRRTLTLMYKY